MAGGGFVDGVAGGRAAEYDYKITPYIFSCIVAGLGGSLFGYDLGVSGGVTSMDDFLKEFFPKVYRRKHAHLHETDCYKYDDQILTLFTSSLYYAALISTFAASHVTRKHGRRASILVGSTSKPYLLKNWGKIELDDDDLRKLEVAAVDLPQFNRRVIRRRHSHRRRRRIFPPSI